MHRGNEQEQKNFKKASAAPISLRESTKGLLGKSSTKAVTGVDNVAHNPPGIQWFIDLTEETEAETAHQIHSTQAIRYPLAQRDVLCFDNNLFTAPLRYMEWNDPLRSILFQLSLAKPISSCFEPIPETEMTEDIHFITLDKENYFRKINKKASNVYRLIDVLNYLGRSRTELERFMGFFGIPQTAETLRFSTNVLVRFQHRADNWIHSPSYQNSIYSVEFYVLLEKFTYFGSKIAITGWYNTSYPYVMTLFDFVLLDEGKSKPSLDFSTTFHGKLEMSLGPTKYRLEERFYDNCVEAGLDDVLRSEEAGNPFVSHIEFLTYCYKYAASE